MSEPFLGEITMVGFNFAPRGWALCDGQLLPINQYQALFSLLGTIYGGDGRTTFALPDLRGRFPIHQGIGPGLTQRTIGQRRGSESETLTISQLPSHSHTAEIKGSTKLASTNEPQNAVYAVPGNREPVYHDASDVEMKSIETSNAGGNQSHSNMQPYLALNFCIALVGIFPSRN